MNASESTLNKIIEDSQKNRNKFYCFPFQKEFEKAKVLKYASMTRVIFSLSGRARNSNVRVKDATILALRALSIPFPEISWFNLSVKSYEGNRQKRFKAEFKKDYLFKEKEVVYKIKTMIECDEAFEEVMLEYASVKEVNFFKETVLHYLGLKDSVGVCSIYEEKSKEIFFNDLDVLHERLKAKIIDKEFNNLTGFEIENNTLYKNIIFQDDQSKCLHYVPMVYIDKKGVATLYYYVTEPSIFDYKTSSRRMSYPAAAIVDSKENTYIATTGAGAYFLNKIGIKGARVRIFMFFPSTKQRGDSLYLEDMDMYLECRQILAKPPYFIAGAIMETRRRHYEGIHEKNVLLDIEE